MTVSFLKGRTKRWMKISECRKLRKYGNAEMKGNSLRGGVEFARSRSMSRVTLLRLEKNRNTADILTNHLVKFKHHFCKMCPQFLSKRTTHVGRSLLSLKPNLLMCVHTTQRPRSTVTGAFDDGRIMSAYFKRRSLRVAV
jgi:hypothetical protein